MLEKSGVDPLEVGRRIRTIRGKKTLQQFARIIGVSHTSVKRYEEGALPDINVLLAVAREGKVDLGWLLLGGPLPEDVRDLRPLRFNINSRQNGLSGSLDESDYITVPLTAGRVAAGSPRIGEEDVIDYFLVHIRAIKRERVSKNLVACVVEGDSMRPQLRSGDIVVIDRDIDHDAVDERKIYAVYHEGGVTVKLVQKEGSDLYLVPLNRREKVMRVDLRENESPLIGQVVAAWRNFQDGVD